MKLALDLGGSTARAKVEGKLYRYPSKYEEVNMDSRVFEDITDKTSDFTILEAPFSGIVGKRYARGEARNYLAGVEGQVDNNNLKVDQSSTYVNSTHCAAIAALEYDQHEMHGGVCIPTSEFYSEGADRIKENLVGSYKVKFNLIDAVVEFKIEQVNVYPEGVVAVLGLMKNQTHARLLTTKTGIIIDAGRRSTDVTILNSMKPIARSARSLPVGGINLEALVAIELEKAGYMVGGDSLDKAISTGEITVGKNKVQVGKYVQAAKRQLAGIINSKIVEVLAANAMQQRELSYVVFMGRCFKSNKPESDAYTGDLGEYLLQELGGEMDRIDVDNYELANINAVSDALAKCK